MGLGCINATNANAAIAQDASFHFAELGKLKAHHSVAVEALKNIMLGDWSRDSGAERAGAYTEEVLRNMKEWPDGDV